MNKKQLTLDKRGVIENSLNNGYKPSKIAKELNVHITTITNEIKKYRYVINNDKNMIKVNPNNKENVIKEHNCDLLKKSPYCCNGCTLKNKCVKPFVIYSAKIADNVSNFVRSDSRKITRELSDSDKFSINYFNENLKKGQTISHICLSLKRLGYNFDENKFYRFVKKRYIEYKPQKIKRKIIKDVNDKQTTIYVFKKELLSSKEYVNFLELKQKLKYPSITEIDLVESNKNESKYILSIFITNIQFYIMFKIENKEPKTIKNCFDRLEKTLGFEMFTKIFKIVIADQGSEFIYAKELDMSVIYDNKERFKLFFCDPAKPYQKSYVENIHKHLRKILPKGCNFRNLTQDNINFIASNLNSSIKKNYGEKNPNEMFIKKFGKTPLNKLGLETFKPSEATLYPYVDKNTTSCVSTTK